MNRYSRAQIEEAIKHWECYLLSEEALDKILVKIHVLAESEEYDREKVKAEVQRCAESPEEVDRFLKKNEARFQKALDQADEKQKPYLKRAWGNLKHASKKGSSFISKHKKKVLALVAIAAAGMFCYPLLTKNWNKVEQTLDNKGSETPPQPETAKAPEKAAKSSQEEDKPVQKIIGKIPYPTDLAVKLTSYPEKIKFLTKQQRENLEFIKSIPNVRMDFIEWLMLPTSKEDDIYSHDRLTIFQQELESRQEKMKKFLEMSGKSHDEFVAFLKSEVLKSGVIMDLSGLDDSNRNFEELCQSGVHRERIIFDAVRAREFDIFSDDLPPEIKNMPNDQKLIIARWIEDTRFLKDPEDYPSRVRSRSIALKKAVEKAKAGNPEEFSNIFHVAVKTQNSRPTQLHYQVKPLPAQDPQPLPQQKEEKSKDLQVPSPKPEQKDASSPDQKKTPTSQGQEPSTASTQPWLEKISKTLAFS